MKGKITLWKGILEGNNDLMKYIVHQNKTKINDEVEKFTQKIGISKAEILKFSKNWIKQKINEWDQNQWRLENNMKTSLKI